MKTIKEKLQYIELIDVYGSLLSKKQISYLKHYYFDDLSLAEIAAKYSVTRAAIHDSITNSISELKSYENSLKLIKKQKNRLFIYNKYIKDSKILKLLVALEENTFHND